MLRYAEIPAAQCRYLLREGITKCFTGWEDSMKICIICGRRTKAKGLCQMHYLQVWRAGSPNFCSVEGCTNGDIMARGMCDVHYTRARRAGTLDVIAPIGVHVDKGCTECDGKHYARGLCVNNWHQAQYRGTLKDQPEAGFAMRNAVS